nr:hypothetical protein CFP56_78817 [Quercus suber]
MTSCEVNDLRSWIAAIRLRDDGGIADRKLMLLSSSSTTTTQKSERIGQDRTSGQAEVAELYYSAEPIPSHLTLLCELPRSRRDVHCPGSGP